MERRRRQERLERRRALRRRLAEGVEETARVEQRRGVETLGAAGLQIMRQRIDVGVAEIALAVEGDVEQRMRVDVRPRAFAHEIEQRVAGEGAAPARVIVGREQRRRARAVAPAGEDVVQQRVGARLVRRGEAVEIVEGVEQRRDLARMLFDRRRNRARLLDLGEQALREAARRASARRAAVEMGEHASRAPAPRSCGGRPGAAPRRPSQAPPVRPAARCRARATDRPPSRRRRRGRSANRRPRCAAPASPAAAAPRGQAVRAISASVSAVSAIQPRGGRSRSPRHCLRARSRCRRGARRWRSRSSGSPFASSCSATAARGFVQVDRPAAQPAVGDAVEAGDVARPPHGVGPRRLDSRRRRVGVFVDDRASAPVIDFCFRCSRSERDLRLWIRLWRRKFQILSTGLTPRRRRGSMTCR